jgi:hypothetical protein
MISAEKVNLFIFLINLLFLNTINIFLKNERFRGNVHEDSELVNENRVIEPKLQI